MKKSILFLLVVSLLLTACSPEAPEKTEAPKPSVKVFDLSEVPEYSVREIGQIKAVQEVELIAQASGTVGKIQKKVGDSVSDGDLIALIDFDESNNPARVNYDNAQIQLSNAQSNYDQVRANNQDSITRSSLRVQTLRETVDRLNRNLDELKISNESTKTTLDLQLENAEKNLSTAEGNYENLVAQFEQSWEDLLKSTETSLNSIFTSLEINFESIEEIINPDNRGYFTVSSLNSGLGAGKSSTRSGVVNDYNELRISFPNSKSAYASYSPVSEGNVNFAIRDVRKATESMRAFANEVRNMLNNSVDNSQLTEAILTSYTSSIGTIETAIISNVATLDALEKSLADFKLNRVSQVSTAENNNVISSNQLADAKNAVIQFETTSRGAVQDLESQIVATQNDILSSEADLASAQRSAGISNNSVNLEIRTLNNQLRLAEDSLNNNQITSPINGLLSEFVVDEGDYVSIGSNLGKIIQSESVKIVFYLSRENSEGLKVGQTFDFTTNQNDGREFVGSITKIAPAADPINKKIKIEGATDNVDLYLKPEMYINLNLDLSQQAFSDSRVYAPMNAVLFNQSSQFVYVLEKGLAQKRAIEVGEVYGSWIEVTQGLDKSDELIIEGQRNLPFAGDVEVNVID